MNKDEKKLADKLRQVLAPHGHFQRIEPYNDKGIPDVNFCRNNAIESWLELKARANKDGSVVIRKEQFAWGQKRTMNGGSVFILAGDPNDSAQVYLYMFPFRDYEYLPLKSGVKIRRPYVHTELKTLMNVL